MTQIGKVLVFLLLVLGIGMATVSVSVYANRPGWFDPPPDGGTDKGTDPVSFKHLSAEIDALTKAATATSRAWGEQLTALERREKTRSDRYARMFGKTLDGRPAVKGLLDWAREGNPEAPGGAGFFRLQEDPASKLLDLNPNVKDLKRIRDRKKGDEPEGTVVLGPDDEPLRGADSLLAVYSKDADEVVRLIAEINRLRAEQKKLGAQVVDTEVRLIKQGDIRENLRDEAAYLAALEVNAAEQRDTATRRKQQLLRRLAVFGGPAAGPKDMGPKDPKPRD